MCATLLSKLSQELSFTCEHLTQLYRGKGVLLWVKLAKIANSVIIDYLVQLCEKTITMNGVSIFTATCLGKFVASFIIIILVERERCT